MKEDEILDEPIPEKELTNVINQILIYSLMLGLLIFISQQIAFEIRDLPPVYSSLSTSIFFLLLILTIFSYIKKTNSIWRPFYKKGFQCSIILFLGLSLGDLGSYIFSYDVLSPIWSKGLSYYATLPLSSLFWGFIFGYASNQWIQKGKKWLLSFIILGMLILVWFF